MSDQRAEERDPAVPEGGFKLWYAVLGSIAAWLIHLTFASSIVQYTCNVPGTLWYQYLATGLTAAATILAMVWSLELVRAGGDQDEAAGSKRGRTVFLGYLGLLFGAIDLALILAEGSYVFFVHRVCQG